MQVVAIIKKLCLRTRNYTQIAFEEHEFKKETNENVRNFTDISRTCG